MMYTPVWLTSPASLAPYTVSTEQLLAAATARTGPASTDAAPPHPPGYTTTPAPTDVSSLSLDWTPSLASTNIVLRAPALTMPVQFNPTPLALDVVNRNFSLKRRASSMSPTTPLSTYADSDLDSRHSSWTSTLGTGTGTSGSNEHARIAPTIALPTLPSTLPPPPALSFFRPEKRRSSLTSLTSPPPPPKRHKKSKMHPCTECEKTFPRPSALATHMNVHSGKKPYICPVSTCAKSFAVRSNARRHMRTHGIGLEPEPRAEGGGNDFAFVPAGHTKSKLNGSFKSLELLSLPRICSEDITRDQLWTMPDLGIPLSTLWGNLLPPVLPDPAQDEERDSYAYAADDIGPYHPSQWKGFLAGPLPPPVYSEC